ncbi:SLBB domain-containing protein [Taibaiella koreensis]|uniref:SLBB domain-containing protein n=1 Tax=Taibaiella koreensis TaxID=1268548 RepID=UPI000E5A0EDB|nr:SLBB domain-containing protein [Taibaiella koreensis]
MHIKTLRIHILKRLFVLLFLLGCTVTGYAQQPAPKQTKPAQTATTDASTTSTPDQVKEASDQHKEDNGEQKDKNARESDQEQDKKQEKNEEVEKRRKTAEGIKGEAGLPIFGNEIFNNPSSSFAPDANRPIPQNYILGPGDKLSIAVTGNSVVSFAPVVSPDGSVSLRDLGKVFVGGRTIENATEVIKEKLRTNRFAIDRGTEVDVTLTNIRSIRITLLGEVRTPGDYTLSSLTTAFNALYESGGITSNGTFRGIKVMRNNEQIAQIDMYDYLLRGDVSANIALQDGDIIMVPEYRVRVSMEGEVKRPAYFEVLPGESLKDVIHFAGGFTDYAYKFSIKAVQLTDKQQRLKDIGQKDFDQYIPLKGDKYTVSRIYNKYENRVSLWGAVYRPGDFELTDGLTLKELIAKADGLKEDAYLERGYITRLKEDNSSAVIPFNVKAIIDGTAEDILLMREDVITVSSIFDYTDAFTVNITGKVRAAGTFPYFNGMTVEDLILKAGGFADGANMVEVEIARRVKDSDRKAKDAKLANIIKVVIDKDLKLAESKFRLEPFDAVSIFALPGYVQPQMVTVEGEVMYPGTYALLTKDDRISDLVARAKGFTAYAYLNGASLRRGDYIATATDAEKQSLKMRQFAEKQIDATNGKSGIDLSDPTKRNNFVDIDLGYVLKHPKGRKDLILLNGDVLNVPRELQTVKVSGEVYSPKTTVYVSGQNLNEYVMRSGGFTDDALKKHSYVVYANGASKGTRHFLFFRNYPNIEPGAEVFIPKRKPRKERDGTTLVQTWVGLSASVASMAALVVAIINSNK